MAEYHVGCGAFAIYAGTLNSRNKNMWQNKTECTEFLSNCGTPMIDKGTEILRKRLEGLNGGL